MNDSLQHIGVPGMRWGRRKSTPSEDHVTSRKINKKKLHEMSNEEIRKLTSRMQLESQYRAIHPNKIATGAKSVNKILKVIGWTVATAATIKSASELGKNLYSKSELSSNPGGLGIKIGVKVGKALIKVKG